MEDPDTSTFWHGGARGLVPGDRIVPRGTAAGLSLLPGTDYDPGQVYLTRDREQARSYAAEYPLRHGGQAAGALYRAQPLGPVSVDHDYPLDPPVCVRCPAARVVTVEEDPVAMTEEDSVRAQARYASWESGYPMYDEEGYLLPSSALERLGVTAEALRTAGPWMPPWKAHVFAGLYVRAEP